MKFLVAIALLVLSIAEAHHVPEHTLRGPRFLAGHTYIYDAFFNVTAGVLGLSSQVSASVLRADVKIHAKSETEHILKIVNVRASGSVSAIEHKYGDIQLEEQRDLGDRLSSPIQFTLQDGKVTRYTLSRKDNLESMKIKRSILRSLEMEIPGYILQKMESHQLANQPIMYNKTENTDYGVHISNYIINASPDVEYPQETVVYNISRIDNYEGEWYPGYHLHHNFQMQGCPEVCRQSGEWNDNFYKAGCPTGFEPHHSPVKRTFNHQHSLSLFKDTLSPEMITTVEVHFANMYDQDMEVLIRYHLHRTEVNQEQFDVESGQVTHDDLHKEDLEITEDEIDQMCDYKNSKEAVKSVRELLREVSDLIVKAEPGSDVGEKIILLRDALSRLALVDFEEVAKEITELEKLQRNSDSKSVARQVWLEILPLIGTPESVKFIVKYIKDELRKGNMLIWEAKEMLESLPQNIERPDEEIITEMAKLLDDDELLSKSNLLHSAVYLTTGRIIGQACGIPPVLRQEDESEKRSWSVKSHQRESPEFRGPPKCPRRAILALIEDISRKLKSTELPEKMAIYVETLTHIGMEEALMHVTDYAHGTAQNMGNLSPKHLTFMKSIVVLSLHNMVGRHPQQVMEIVLPIYFNETEAPKLRNAAFGVMIRCQPSLSLLQRVATHTWFEKSQEVGSFVTSTLESFGNSTLPCMQLLAHRIKEILPQANRFKIGVHHAKNHMWTYYDALRRFGLEGRFEYTPNNESVVPSTFYHALTYTIDSLRDTVFQSSLNIEGLTQEMLLKRLISYMDLPNIEPISREKEIFGKGDEGMDFMQPRTVEDLRLVTYHKLFYKSSYNYLNSDGIRDSMKEFSEIFEKYLRKTNSKYSGYLVKLFLPSTYHTKAVAKTLPYPVEFQMRQPIVISLGVKMADSMRTKPTISHFDLHLTPSIHLSKVFTHHMKNMRDCKEVGVYHTHKIAMTYPFQIKYDGDKFPKVTFKYRIPEGERKVLYYYTESGTYAGKKELKTLPLDETREPIRTLPTPFKFEKDISLVGIPPFHIEIETEDINLFHQRMPRTPTEALHLAVKNILNAGWRYQSANITLVENRALWTGENEATFEVEYSRNHVVRTRRSSMSPQDDSDWSVAQPSKKHYGSSVWQRQTDNYRNSQRRPNSRQSEDVTETSWWGSKDPQPMQRWPGKEHRQSEDDEWNTESSNIKQWEDDDSITSSPAWGSKKFKQSEDDDWNKELPLRQSDDDDWNRKLPLRQSDDDDSNRELPLRQSEDEDWSQYMEPNEHESFSDFSKNAKAVSRMMTTVLPHINHRLKIRISTEPLSSTAYFLMDYNHTYDKYLHVLRLQAASKRANNERPYEVELNHVIGYLNQPDELHYDDEFKGQRSVFRTAFNWPKGRESGRPWDKMDIIVLGKMHYESNRDLLNEQLKEKVGEEYFLPETHEECKRDVEDERPLSINCIKAIRERSAFNRINMAIQWSEELPQQFKQVAHVADIYLKHHFFEHLHLKLEENEPRRIDIASEYIDKFVDEPLANWEFKKPSETVILRQIPIANAQPFSSMYPMYEAALLKVTNNTYPARCVLSDSYVQTYDLVTYPFKPENCHYVLSSHCTENKNFAILLRGSGRNKEIHIHVASTRIVLLPPRDRTTGYPIKNGREDITVLSPVILNEKQDIYAYLERHQSDRHLRVIAKKAGINVLYDGKTVKIEVSPRYKGELCGLCSEFDGEDVREFRGMDRCLYTDPIDFANSNLVKRSGNCGVHDHRGERMCEDSRFEDWENDSDSTPSAGGEPRLQRNVVIYRGDEVCFSVRPVPACPENAEPTETESQRIGFHCLPKDDLTAKKMIAEADWRILDELRRKSVDHVQRVEVPKRC